jgi:hypothetical protein
VHNALIADDVSLARYSFCHVNFIDKLVHVAMGWHFFRQNLTPFSPLPLFISFTAKGGECL